MYMQRGTRREWAGAGWSPICLVGLAIVFAVFAPTADASGIWRAECHDPSAPAWSLSCDIQPIAGRTITSVLATANGTELEATKQPLTDAGKSAVIFLIDRSDPHRAAAIRASADLVDRVITSDISGRHNALGVFDADLSTLVPFTPFNADWRGTLAGIQPAGHGTAELYHAVHTALPLLRATGAMRKAIILLSSGKATDKAYTLAGVAEEARKDNVVINAIGFAESPADSPDLTVLRRLAEETGGEFIEAAVGTHKVQLDPVRRMMGEIDAGERVTVSLKAMHGPQDIVITATDSEKEVFTKTVSVTLPTEAALPEAPPNPEDSLWSMVGRNRVLVAVGVAVIVALLTGLSWYIAILYRGRLVRPAAWIEILGNEGKKRKLTKSATRIGRNNANDIVLPNETVSAFHAEVHRLRDGTFRVTDLTSRNKIYVDQEPVQSVELRGGTIFELGEVRMRFIQDEERRR